MSLENFDFNFINFKMYNKEGKNHYMQTNFLFDLDRGINNKFPKICIVDKRPVKVNDEVIGEFYLDNYFKEGCFFIRRLGIFR